MFNMKSTLPSESFTYDAPSSSKSPGMGTAGVAAARSASAVRRSVPLVMLAVFAVLFTAVPAGLAQVDSAIEMGTAEDFAVLADDTITNTGISTISGDVGLWAGTSVTGFDALGANSVVHTGDLHITDAVAQQAQVDLLTAYNSAASFAETGSVPAQLGTQTFLPGVYTSDTGAFLVDGQMILDAGGDENAVFIFKAGSTLTTGSSSSMLLLGDASPCNIYWLVGSSATLGTNSSLSGIVMAVTSITLDTGASVEGRVLAQEGAVTLDSNLITNPDCTTAVVVPPTTAPADATTTTTTTDTVFDELPTTTTTATAAAPVTTSTSDTTSDTLAPPIGGVDTGGGSTAQNTLLAYAGFGLLVAAVGAFGLRRRLAGKPDKSA